MEEVSPPPVSPGTGCGRLEGVGGGSGDEESGSIGRGSIGRGSIGSGGVSKKGRAVVEPEDTLGKLGCPQLAPRWSINTLCVQCITPQQKQKQKQKQAPAAGGA